MTVRSAGGVVFQGKEQKLQILMIQDRYGKITLPKGKMEAGETIEQTALREILEETGIQGTIQRHLETVHYQYEGEHENVDKQVDYFLVEHCGGQLHAQIEEIRGVEWLAPQDAWHKQQRYGYENNLSVMRKALDSLGFSQEG